MTIGVTAFRTRGTQDLGTREKQAQTAKAHKTIRIVAATMASRAAKAEMACHKISDAHKAVMREHHLPTRQVHLHLVVNPDGIDNH